MLLYQSKSTRFWILLRATTTFNGKGRKAMAIASIHHISITAPQQLIDEVAQFYTAVLGLTEGYRPDFGVPGNWLYQDDHPLVHLLALDNEPGSNGHFDHIAFLCTDLTAMIEKLQSHDIEYSVFKMPELNQTQLFITDPAGIKVELNFHGEKLE
jgi:catechol 2,3-dioxygenase-like lactoylglutathione lyase family enzyme